jgi:hypothetical protein
LLRCKLIDYVSDSAAQEIPAAVLSRIIDFRDFEARPEDYERLFVFCVEYLRAHGSASSQILRTLDVTRLSSKDLGRLCALEQLNRGVLNDSFCRSLIAMRQELSRERQRNETLRKDLGEQQREARDLWNEVDEQRNKISVLAQEIGQLAGERDRQEETVARQSSDIERLKGEKKRTEDDLRGLEESNEQLKREVGKLKEEMKRLPHPVQICPFQQSAPLDGIIAHLSRKCGGNVHDRGIVNVTSSSRLGGSPTWDGKNAFDLKSSSVFHSDGRWDAHSIPHTRNQWISYDFQETKIIPTQYSIRSRADPCAADGSHPKSWLVEVSMDGSNWTEIDHQKKHDNSECDQCCGNVSSSQQSSLSASEAHAHRKESQWMGPPGDLLT